MPREGTASRFADFIAETRAAALPDACVHAAKRCFVDYVGVALAGSTQPIAKALKKYICRQKGNCSVWGCRDQTSMEGAAFINGTLGHVLDYDDVKANIGHISVTLAPAVIAMGEELGKSGSEILTAFVAGAEISSRVANSVEPAHSQQGWHPTATCGIFGVAAACGKLLDLDRDALRGMFGIAGSFSGGLRRNNGTPTKPFHAGQTAQNGLKAAILASLGIYGDPDIFDGKKSFGEAFSSPSCKGELTRDLGQNFELLKNGFKVYPCCASAHTAIDAVLSLREENSIDPAEISGIRVGTVPLVLDNLPYGNPQNIGEGRFSMSFCLSLALVDGKVTLENFTEERLRDARVKDLMGAVTLFADPEMVSLGYRGTENANVKIFLKSGRTHQKRVDTAIGHPLNPVPDEGLKSKFRSCTKQVLPPESSERLLSLLFSFEQLPDLKGLLSLTSAG